MAFEITRQEITKQANDLLKLFRQTRDQKYKDEENRLRRIVIELEAFTGGGGGSGVSQIIAGTNVTISPTGGTGNVTVNATTQTLNQVTTAGNTTTNAIDVGGITSDYFTFDTAATPTPSTGMMFWDQDALVPAVQLDSALAGKIFQDEFWYVKNQTGSTIPKGTVVMAVGTLGASSRILVAPMVADGSVSAKYILGITAESIANGADGSVMRAGKIRNLDTSMYSAGAVLYANPATPGGLTATLPSAPNLKLAVAFVVHAASNGVLAVRVEVGSDLYEDHRVQVSSPANNQLLRYNSTTSRWENWTPNFLTSYTETDPTVPSHVKAITTTNISNWNTAYTNRIASLTTTGTSGAATLSSNTLNIPNYTLAGLGYAVPTLQQVTTAGNTTTNAITVGGVTSSGRIVIGTLARAAQGSIHTSALGIFEGGVSVQYDSGGGAYVANFTYETGSGGYLNIQSYASKPLYINHLANHVYIGGNGNTNVIIGSTTNAGYKLDVNGTARVVSSALGISTNGLLVTAVSGDTRNVSLFLGNTGDYNPAANTNTVNASVAGIRLDWYTENWRISATRGGGADIKGLLFSRNGVERMVIDSNGNVGIGNTSPSEKLHVSGKIRQNNGGDLYLDANATNTIIASSGARPLYFEVNGAYRITSTATGNVLIGTTTDSGYKLDVNGSIRTAGDVWVENANPRIALIDTNNNSDYYILNNDGSFSVYDVTNAAQRLWITNSGRIGIGGVTAPSARVESSDVDNSAIVIRQSNTAASSRYAQLILTHGISYFAANDVSYQLVSNGITGGQADFLIQYWNGSTYNEWFTVKNTGNVGIGIPNPTTKLDVNGSINSTGYYINGTIGYNGTISIPTNPPGMQNIDVQSGIIVNVF
jgi:hypothetical protein